MTGPTREDERNLPRMLAALRTPARSAGLMVEQVEHLIELSRLPNVDLGLISWDTAVEVFPSTAFHLYDRATAVVDTNDGTAIITERPRLDAYRTLFEQLVTAATFGEHGRAQLARIADEYRAIARLR